MDKKLGPASKAWLTMMAFWAVLGTTLTIVYQATCDKSMAASILENGATMLGIMAFAFGLVHVIKAAAEDE